MKEFLASIPALLREGIGIAGAASVTFGCWQAWHPLGPIVGGSLCLAAAWMLAKRMDE